MTWVGLNKKLQKDEVTLPAFRCNFGKVQVEASQEIGAVFVASVAEAVLCGCAIDQLLQTLAFRQILDQPLELVR